ncbi:unnamed protein product [Meganyctiphanes norvegica]|uniref:Uncharacterized protein n=1 Tax=Meganyctiphanes norvegica TaxID=48144 RepID=A0AAV2RVQ1_MEGNR
MKAAIVFSCFIAMGMAAPQFDNFVEDRPIAILRSDSEMDGPNFRYGYESEDGTAVDAVGSEGFNGGTNIEGSYRFTLPSGEQVEVKYVANENGALYSSPILPQQVQAIHAIPAHALEQIRFAEEQRAQGVQWDQQGFRIN